MMKIKVGDRVSVLDDNIEGRVVKVLNNRVYIESEDGFDLDFNPEELVLIDDVGSLDMEAFTTQSLESVLKDKKSSNKTKPKLKVSQKGQLPPMEVDLHIHQLTNSTKGMTNHDMLTLQVDTARNKLEFAIRNRIQRVVFIHGVGEGVLRMELEYLFGRYDNIKFYDANYQKYGLGATEIYIFQNS